LQWPKIQDCQITAKHGVQNWMQKTVMREMIRKEASLEAVLKKVSTAAEETHSRRQWTVIV